jgi:predicted Holliday junction resolvase-like endonuclease
MFRRCHSCVRHDYFVSVIILCRHGRHHKKRRHRNLHRTTITATTTITIILLWQFHRPCNGPNNYRFHKHLLRPKVRWKTWNSGKLTKIPCDKPGKNGRLMLLILLMMMMMTILLILFMMVLMIVVVVVAVAVCWIVMTMKPQEKQTSTTKTTTEKKPSLKDDSQLVNETIRQRIHNLWREASRANEASLFRGELLTEPIPDVFVLRNCITPKGIRRIRRHLDACCGSGGRNNSDDSHTNKKIILLIIIGFPPVVPTA